VVVPAFLERFDIGEWQSKGGWLFVEMFCLEGIETFPSLREEHGLLNIAVPADNALLDRHMHRGLDPY
jgi:hypothetical protein